uniref:Uncharacterized protein n=1 Tax=Brassica campestris TaxID=3711 RepID=M4DFJ4_BRACM
MYENEKRERVVKASRDITINSKKVIFQVHRLSKDSKEEVLEKARKDLEAVREQHFARMMKELQGTDFWKLRRAYSPRIRRGMVQETENSSGAIGVMLSADAAMDCGLRKHNYIDVHLKKMVRKEKYMTNEESQLPM